MMRRLSSDFMIPALTVVAIGVVVGFLVYGGDTLLGLDTDDTNTIISLMPGVIILLVAFYGVSQSSGVMLSGSIMGVGLAFALLIHLMDQANLLILQTGMAASDIEIVVIIIFLIIAMGLSVRQR